MARINLLPWREIQRAQKQREFIVVMGGAALFMALAVLNIHIVMGSRVDYQEQRNQFLQNEITEIDKKIREINDLEKTKTRLLARMQVIQQLQGSRPEVVHLFDEIAKTVPEGVHINELNRVGKGVTLKGLAQSNARVSTYMRNLDASPWMGNPRLNVIHTRKASRVRASDFTLHVRQTRAKTASADGAS